MSESLLEVSDLRVDFRHEGHLVRAVDGLTYSVHRGRTVAVIGESGSGKTVSSRAIMGLLPSTAKVTGSIRFDEVEMVGLAESVLCPWAIMLPQLGAGGGTPRPTKLSAPSRIMMIPMPSSA